VSLGDLFDSFYPHARLASAIVPVVITVILRFVFGSGKVVNTLVSIATVWFTVNVLAAPYSFRMQQDLDSVRQFFR
jgi:hypothetical protein